MNVRLGYVRIEEGHPFYGVPLDKPIALEGNRTRLNESADLRDVGMDGLISIMCGKTDEWLKTINGYLKIHGGLGYSDKNSPGDFKDDGGWWLGWDGGHAGDYLPFDLECLKLIRGPVRVSIGGKNADRWTAYIRRIEEGEASRDYSYEAGLDGLHYWTLDDAVLETERLAEQLSIIALLGIRKEGDE
jgi:hypothetical protein